MTHVLRRRAWIARFQLVREAYDRLRLRVAVRRRPTGEEVADLERDALAYRREPMRVEVEIVERIEQEGRKFRDLVGLPAPRRGAP